ncbi:MAG: Holliday junction branch migration protein RuvA [Eubacterium sp.]|nr:Holliday junction branch migration protein RuvA [Eubacterium sp.]
MIAYLKGTVEEIEQDALLIDRGGIGFRVYVPATLLDGSVRTGDQVKIHTYLNVKEDALTLYGFADRDDLEVFKLLTGVSGIGPKGAMGILSTLSADDLRFAVLSDDVTFISKAPGIGKKTAQKVILELKDKFKLEDAVEKKLAHAEAGAGDALSGAGGSASQRAQSDAVEALVALGYSGTEALQAVRKAAVTEEMDSEAILKQALKMLF